MAYSVNLIPNREFAVIHLNQYEYGTGNTRTVAIYNGDVPFDIPSGSDISIEGVKPDGNAFAYDDGITFEDNEVTFELQDQMTVLAGQFPVEIVIRNSQGRWSTKNLIFDIEAGPVNENTPISDEDIPAYIDLAQRNANRAVSAAETATSAASTATSKATIATNAATTATTAASSATTAATTATTKATIATEAASTATSAAASAAESEANADMYQEIAKTAADDVRPIITEVGDVVVTENAKEEKLFYFKADFSPKQDFNGYDHAWAPGGGKNKLQATVASRTHYGITYTLQDDGGIKVQGTSTGTSLYYFFDQTGASSQTVFTNGSYTLTGGVDSNIYITGFTTTDNTGRFDDTGTGVTFTVSNGFIRYIRLVVKSGTTVDTVIYPMIRLASEADATFEPYENICPISGYTGITIRRTGRNLLPSRPPLIDELQGVAREFKEDGTAIFNGTATGKINNYWPAISEGNWYKIPEDLPKVPMIFTGAPDGSSASTYRFLVYTYKNGVNISSIGVTDSGIRLDPTDDSFNQIRILFQIYAGVTVDNLVVKPLLRLEGDEDTEYETKGVVYGENLFKAGEFNGKNGYSLNSSGVEYESSAYGYTLNYTRVGNGPLKLGGGIVDSGHGTRLFYYDSDFNFISRSDPAVSYDALPTQTFYPPANAEYIRIQYAVAAINPSTLTVQHVNNVRIEFPTAAGTVYGGYAEVYENGTGKLVVNQVTKTFNGTENWYLPSGTHHVIAIQNITPNVDPSMIWSDDHDTAGKIIATNGVTPWFYKYSTLRSVWPSACIRIANNGIYLAIGEEYDTVEKGKAWLAEHPFQIAYYIEPVTYDLTNQQVLQMLDDRNIIWMDANGQIEISFRNNSKLNEYLDVVSGVQYSDITQAGTVTEAGTKVVDAVQMNPNVNGTVAHRLDAVETVANAAIPKTNITRTAQSSTGSKVVDAYELNASKSGTLAKKISDNTTNITTNTNALNGFKFGFTSDNPPKPGYIVPGGADTVIPFKTGGIVLLGSATQTFSQNTVVTLASGVDLSEYTFLGIFEDGSAASHPYNTMEYSIGSVVRYRTHYHTDNTNQDPRNLANPQFSMFIPVSDRSDTVSITVKNSDGNTPAFAGTITLYGFKGEIEQ